MHALLVNILYGTKVSAEQMMPAETDDQRDLWVACLENNVQSIQNLLAKDVSPNFYHYGNIPLVTACQHINLEVVQLLVENGVDVNTADWMGNSPCAEACKTGI
mgnify:CR=1 FL=1